MKENRQFFPLWLKTTPSESALFPAKQPNAVPSLLLLMEKNCCDLPTLQGFKTRLKYSDSSKNSIIMAIKSYRSSDKQPSISRNSVMTVNYSNRLNEVPELSMWLTALALSVMLTDRRWKFYDSPASQGWQSLTARMTILTFLMGGRLNSEKTLIPTNSLMLIVQPTQNVSGCLRH